MTRSETVVVLGLLVGLLAATVLPFALPALRADGGAIPRTPSPVRDKSNPAAFSPEPVVETPETASTDRGDDAENDTGGSTRRSTPPRTGRPTLAGPGIRCDVGPSRGEFDGFPLTVGGRTVTGENVTVAVVDPSGFDVDDPRIADQVAATRSFASGGASLDLGNGGNDRHGTESAATVARAVPDADLHLANFETAHDFTEAIGWAVERDADLIVAPAAFYAKPNDGTAPVSRAVTEATERGVPVVVPTGNVATRHWEGTYRGGPWLEFAPEDTRMYLRGSDRPVQIWLWWNRSDDEERHDLRIHLYEDTGDGAKRIAASEDYPRGPVGTNQVLFEKIRTNDLLSTSIENGTYYVRIEGPPDAVHRIELVATAHRLEDPTRRGSLMAPATASGDVIAVGAARETTGRPLETSSVGPTNDGRPGIDLLAPGRIAGSNGVTFTGTSAATAYTGGVVAAMRAIDPTLTPSEAESILQATATPVGSDDGPLATGHGLIDPAAAVTCARARAG